MVLQQSQRLRRGLNSHETAAFRAPRAGSRAGTPSSVCSARVESGPSCASSSSHTNYLVLPCQREIPLLLVGARTQSACWAVKAASTVASRVRSSRRGEKTRTFTVSSTEREALLVVEHRELQHCTHCIAGKPSVLPNPSLKLTRYGRLCKPGSRQSYYCRVPGLQSLPPRAA